MRFVEREQPYLDWFTEDSGPKVVREYQERYRNVSDVLEKNPEILRLVHADVRELSTGRSRKRRTGDYTTENILRALLVKVFEGTSFRQTVVRISESPTLRHFVRLGEQRVMDFTFLNKCFNAIRPGTWRKVNRVLAGYAVEQEDLDVSDLRIDTTVVEANIHYPTDSSLLWDSWRVLTRLLRAGKEWLPEIAGHRFHDRKVKKIHLWLTRHAGKGGTRKRRIRRQGRRLVEHVRRVYEIGERAAALLSQELDPLKQALGQEFEELLPVVAVVLETTERSLVKSETVPAKERVFSIFEPHVELIKRGKKGKPIEFGHAVVLCQTREKLITDYEVMEEKIPDQELTDVLLERHQEQFGAYPDGVTADTGFNPAADKRKELEEKVTDLAIPQKVFDWGQTISREWQCFRAGIEGSISVLKRAFGLFRCLNRGFRNFAASVGLAIVGHNLLKVVELVNG